MKRILLIFGLLFGLATGVAQAQTRVGVSLRFGDPYLAGQVVIGRPYYHRYAYPYYYRYHRAPVIVYEPRYYRAPVVVLRSHGAYGRRHGRYRRW